MNITPHVRVMPLLGLMVLLSAGCISTTSNDATPVSQTPMIVVATDAPIVQPTTFVPAPTPTIPPPTLVAPTSIGVTDVPATVLPPMPTSSSAPTSAVVAPSPSPVAADDELEHKLIKLINQNRITAGCTTLMTESPALTTAASRHSQDMATHNFLGHTGSDGSTRASRAQDAGYVIAAGQRVRENIAMFSNPEDAISSWMQDPITRDQMLDCNYNDIGIGYADINSSQSNKYWTALFGVRP